MRRNQLLKAKIIEKFGTASDFAQTLKIHESRISQIVCGRRQLDVEAQKTWASLLDADREKLFNHRR
jgi:plasmid maintenance system antidote protein VapI